MNKSLKTGIKVIDFSKPRTGYITKAAQYNAHVTWHSAEVCSYPNHKFTRKNNYLELTE